MPLSTNDFSDDDVEYIREICRIPNTTDGSNIAVLVGKLDALIAASVTACTRDIEQWKRIEYGTEKSKGGIKGTDYDTERNRVYITNKMRARLGYDPIAAGLAADDFGMFSINFPSSFGGRTEDEFTPDGSNEW